MILAEIEDQSEEDDDQDEGAGGGFAVRFHDTLLPAALKALKVKHLTLVTVT